MPESLWTGIRSPNLRMIQRIVFRLDGGHGSGMGLGHVYRSLALASDLRARHPQFHADFVMRPFADAMAKVRAQGFSVIPLSDRSDTETIAQDFLAAIKELRPDLLVVDTLGSSRATMAAARQLARRIMTIDDVEEGGQEADIVLNGIVWLWRWLPETWGRAHVLQGAPYNVLRPEFVQSQGSPRRVPEAARRVLVTVGGADEGNVVEALLHELRDIQQGLHITLVLGAAHPDPRRVVALAGPSIQVMHDVDSVATLMRDADVAVTAGGTSLFELAACGTPAICVPIVEHQLAASRWFAERGAALDMGRFQDLKPGALSGSIRRLAADPTARQRMSDQAQQLVDGRGLERVRRAIDGLLCDAPEGGVGGGC